MIPSVFTPNQLVRVSAESVLMIMHSTRKVLCFINLFSITISVQNKTTIRANYFDDLVHHRNIEIYRRSCC